MIIKGRGDFVGQLQGSAIRVDDKKNSPFWLEVHLTRDELEKLLEALNGDEDEGEQPCDTE